MSIFNGTAAQIIRECAMTEKGDCYECGEACADFEDTLADLPKANMTYTIDSLPILKCDKKGKECCKEEYMIEHDILTKMMESYEIEDPVEAHRQICEHYGISIDSLTVVVESDNVNKGLIGHAKKSKDTGLIKSYTQSIKNLKNKGIKVAKKASNSTRFNMGSSKK